MTAFVNRVVELERLQECFDASGADLAVVYGRRRLGKTRLLKRALEEAEDAVYYQARQKTKPLQIEQFVDAAAEAVSAVKQQRQEWEVLFQFLAEQGVIVVIDEFPYLIEQDESLPSVLQALFDHEFEDATTTFVLVGSSISMMEEATLLGDSPLYGRSSLKLDVRPLRFGAATEFLPPDVDPDHAVRTWSVFGGVPYYLEELEADAPLGENVRRTILARHGTLHDEPEYVLRMELQNPTRYFSILEAIAGGAVGRNEIAGATGIEYSHLSRYLDRLSRLRLIERHVPVTERHERSKRGRYRLRDPLFRFWFRFVYGGADRYDELGADAYDRLVKPAMADFVAPTFEELCGRALWSLYEEYPITDVGQWWYRDHEVDVVGLTDGSTLVAGECKYQQSPVGFDALSTLQDHAGEIRWTPKSAEPRDTEYALFARRGFTDAVREAADERDDLRLYTIADMVDVLTERDGQN